MEYKNRMILAQKHKLFQKTNSAQEFDKFLKIRSQKQSIIQSQSQHIAQKVQGFQQLLKLTKTGSSISTLNLHKKHQYTHTHNKSQSSKTINVIGRYNTNNQNQFNRFQDIQSDQAQMKKLNKMVFGITQWEQDHQKPSFHAQKKPYYPKTSYSKKRNLLSNQKSNIQKQIKQRKLYAYTACTNKKFRKFYTPLNKNEAQSQLNKINSNYIKTSAKVNYPPNLLKCNFLEQNNDKFKDLKNKIKVLQAKAKNEYGLNFNSTNIQNSKKDKGWEAFSNNSEDKENQQLDYKDLQLGPILAKDYHNRYRNYSKSRDEYCDREDSSIPKSLIGIVQNRQESIHNVLQNNLISKQLSSKKDKMKKGYVYRPKSFKPTYTYIKI